MSGHSRFYSMSLHAVLVALVVCTILLARQNRLLGNRLAYEAPQSAFQVGEPLTPFEVQEADNSLRLLTVGETQRPSLLFFFNTSCSACRENRAHWRALYDALADSTEVIGVSLDGPEPTSAYVDQMELPCPA